MSIEETNNQIFMFLCQHNWNKEECKDHESILPSTTSDQDTEWQSDKTQENITYQKAKRSALSQQVTTRLQQQIHHIMAKTRHVPLRAAQFLTPIPEFDRVESPIGWSAVLDYSISWLYSLFREKCLLGYATYQISRLYAMWFLTDRTFSFPKYLP